MRKYTILFALATVAFALFLIPGMAMANMAIHGGYPEETDSCAACHRAHTATSPITWDNGTEQRSALLISTATLLKDFCYTCHGDNAAGAATNVYSGVYEADAHGENGQPLNSGAFTTAAGWHSHTVGGGDWQAYGGGPNGLVDQDPANTITGTGKGPDIWMDCGSCHDVHGSSNYRLLKDLVNGVQVGGYDPLSLDPTNPDPQPFVISNEEGYPQEGWRLGEAGHTDMLSYKPNYTRAEYAKAPPAGWVEGEDPDPSKGISAWCAACHTQYTSTSSQYHANDMFDDNNWGFITRYRHPVNVELDNFNGARPLNIPLLTERDNLPVAHSSRADIDSYDGEDWINCLTCHRAHGTNSVMSGWATNQTEDLPWTTETGADGPLIQYPNNGDGNFFLRLDDRGVCQQCHYK